MRRLICFFCAILFSALLFAERIVLLSFNINGAAKSHRAENAQWVADICHIIEQSGADIVFLQEVCVELDAVPGTNVFKKARSHTLLDDFTETLGKGEWSYFSTADYGLRKTLTVNEQEYIMGDKTQNNAILYRSDKLDAHDFAQELGFTSFSGDYLFDKNTVQVVRFTSRGADSGSALVGINAHLPYNNAGHRDRDLRTLQRLYARYKLRYGLVLTGDLNMRRAELTDKNFDIIDGDESWYADRHFGLKTTVGKSDADFRLANDYDHFLYNARLRVTQQMRRLFSAQKDDVFHNGLHCGGLHYATSSEFKQSVSDHVPIVLVVEL